MPQTLPKWQPALVNRQSRSCRWFVPWMVEGHLQEGRGNGDQGAFLTLLCLFCPSLIRTVGTALCIPPPPRMLPSCRLELSACPSVTRSMQPMRKVRGHEAARIHHGGEERSLSQDFKGFLIFSFLLACVLPHTLASGKSN